MGYSSKTYYEKFYGHIKWSLRRTSNKSRIVTSAINRFKLLWRLFVERAEKRHIVAGRTIAKNDRDETSTYTTAIAT
jgi:hypothetical protein